MTMRGEDYLNAHLALFGRGNLARAGLMAVLGGVLMLAEVGCSSNSTSGNRDGGGHGGTAAAGSSAITGPATTASGGQTGTSATGQTGTGGSLAPGGGTASAGGIGLSGGSPSTSTAMGGGPVGGTSAGGSRATGGTTVSGGATVSGGTTGASSTTTIVAGTSGGNGGSVAGGSATAGSATGGSAGAGSTGTVPPGNPDAGLDAAIVLDSGPVADAAGDGGANADADAGGEGDSGHILSCEEILLDNPGPPDNYPVLYQVAASTPDPLAAEKAQLISTPLAGGPFNDNNTLPAVEPFLSKWETLYGYQGIQTTAGPVSCGVGPLCIVRFTQNYCGLSIYSSEAASRGTWRMDFYSQTGKVLQVISGLVHMIPMPRNVLVTQTQIISAIAGKKFTYDCGAPTGSYTVEISDQDQFSIPGPGIYVQTSPTVPSALEYRLAIPVKVTAKGDSWTVYVDAIDGSYIAGVANFICS